MKVIKRIILVILILGVLFVVGDYFGMFISFHADGAMLIPYVFKFVNTVDGSVVRNVEVTAEYEGNPFGKEFHFGENSTTIKLQDANTENMDDVFNIARF